MLRPDSFSEIHPPLASDEALVESGRCLYCFDAPCTRACPTHIDIPRFIRQIRHKDSVSAANTILDANIFGGSCARICPTQVLCEGACVDNTHLKSPVQIGRLQRFACDAADARGIDFHEPGPDSGKRVAIIGAGPAGLTCAHELRKHGHAVTVFEAREVAGGLNTLGIAAYKITTEFALSEVDRVLRMGIDLRLKTPVDGPKLAHLLNEYDAVFLGIGLGQTAPLGIPGEDLEGVWESLRFVFQLHARPPAECEVGRNVIVIGGGNTAIDAANAAIRLGAESVTVAYRRDAASMPAFRHEYELALASGVKFEWMAAPVRIVGDGRRAAGVECARTRVIDDSASRGANSAGAARGRTARVEVVPGSEFTLAADMVIRALGQERLLDLLMSVRDLKLDATGRIEVDPATGATCVPRLFAGGDCQSKAGEEVVNAVQAGKLAAAGVHAFIVESQV